ncbi:hypothetical protein ACFL3B_00515 [Gemmatimonadota bacterium]
MSTVHFRVRRLVACMLLPTMLAACMTWKTQDVSPRQLVNEQQPDTVRVTLADGTRFTLGTPGVSGDTIFGNVASERMVFPFDDVAELSVRGTSATKTIGLVVLGAITIFCVVAIAGDFEGGMSLRSGYR